MQGIEFQIINDSTEAAKGIDTLAKSLEGLKTSLGSGGGSLSTVAKNIGKIRDAVSGLNTQKLTELGTALEGLKTKTEGLKISSSIANQLQGIGDALNNVPDVAQSKLTALADGLRPLTELGKSNLSSFINQLGKLPEVITALDSVDIEKFAQQMERLSAAMKPFADEMQKVSSGFAAFPSRIQKLITSTERYNGTVQRAATNTSGWSRALKTVSFAAVFRKTSQWLGSAITKANEYIETLNMFTVSMGDYAKQAYNYAQTVSEVMGIDPSTWMENQGVFNSIITGFGVAEDKAYTMSKNLTQLAYDLSSFYNSSVTEAMQKVQSGISGELEPLRRWGMDLSVARLQQEALNLGINKSVSSMTQAEKAQLRYHAMLTQVTQVQGDMARTLDQPANQLRVLKAQVEQAARAFGNLFIPILNTVIPVAVAVASAIREIINAIAALFGVEMADNVEWGDSLTTAAGATGDIANDMDEAASSAKKMKSYLMGFDELNVINPNDGSGSGSTAGGSSFDIDPIDYDFLGDAVTERIDAIKAKLEPFVTWVEDHLSGILTVVGMIGAAFLMWKLSGPFMTVLSGLKTGLNVVWQLAGRLMGNSGPLTSLASSVGKFAAVAGTIAVIVLRFIDLYNNSEKFRTGLERLGEIGEAIFGGIQTVVSDVAENLKQFGLRLLDLLPESVKENILGFFQKVQEWAGKLDLDWKDFAITIAGIAALFVPGGQLVGAALLGFEGISIGIRSLGSVSDEEFTAMLETVKGVFSGIWEFAKGVLDGMIVFLTGVFTQDWGTVFSGLSGIAGAALDLIGDLTETLFGVNIVNVVSDWFEEHVKPWFSLETWKELGKQALDGLFNGLANMWERAKTWGSDLLQNVKDVLGIASPSKEFEEIGEYSIAGMEQGFSGMSGVSAQFSEQLTVMRSYASEFSTATLAMIAENLAAFTAAMLEAQTTVLSRTNNMTRMFQNMSAQSVSAINSIISRLDAIPRSITTVHTIITRNVSEGSSGGGTKAYATGGFPDMGQMFIAREAGPELVGTIGNRTAVVNNEQIVSSVAGGVAEANESQNALLREQNELLRAILAKDTGVKLDGKTLLRSTEKAARQRGTVIMAGGVTG